MKKNYHAPEVEIVESLDVVTTSGTVETDRIPLVGGGVQGTAYEEIFDI